MADEIKPFVDVEDEPATVATPEGDNEFAPEQPLTAEVDGLQVPPGSAPDSYRKEKD